ncbi:MAG: ATP synthase F1 subunit gamma [Vampirovibrio sp.]
MPNLKDIRTRIKSIKNTQKITQAMRMVAAAKVRKAENHLKQSRPFTDLLEQLMIKVFPELLCHLDVLRESPYFHTLHTGTVRRVGLFVVAADRGLCGSYNSVMLKKLNTLLTEYREQNIVVRLYLVGNKSIRYVAKQHADLEVLAKAHHITLPVDYIHAEKAGDLLLQAFLNRKIDRLEVLYTQFNNMVSYEPIHKAVLPIDLEALEAKALNAPAQEKKLGSSLEFEPEPLALIEEIIPMYVKRQLFGVLLESVTSELASRMTAMANATDNAKDLIHRLTLIYNKARQAAITQEIMEIVGGAEALK